MEQENQTPDANPQPSEQGTSQSTIFGILFVAGLVVIAGLAYYFFVVDTHTPLPELNPDFDVEAIEDNSIEVEFAGRLHVDDDEPVEYTSNPPTSGDHNGRWISPIGTYTEQLSDRNLVHNLEHGHVWLSYRDEDDEQAIELLRLVQEKYRDRVIVTHRPENDTRIAASAWLRLLTLEELDGDQLEAFVVRHSDNAPESILEG